MGFLDKLESIFHLNLSGLKKFNINFQVNNNNKTVHIDKLTINIDTSKLSAEQIPAVREILRELVEIEKQPLFLQDTKKLLGEFKDVDSGSESQELISFFRGKIPPTDIEILRQAVFIKNKLDKREDVKHLKDGVVRQYGSRGRNICNLYSAGYFTAQIKPLYQELVSRPTFYQAEFDAAYERIVTESPYAIFVSNIMDEGEIVSEVKRKITVAKNYGIHYLNIHGIGRENVNNIIKIMPDLQDSYIPPPEIAIDGNIIVVKLNF